MYHERWYGLAVAVLATWRVTHLLAKEDGPWDAIVALRLRVADGFVGSLMDCFYCLSLWMAAPAAYLVMSRWREWPMLWLAISGAACLLERLTERPGTTQTVPQGEK
jgi:Protein of unknown function (DUF1360)